MSCNREGIHRAKPIAPPPVTSGQSGIGFLIAGNLIVTNNHVLPDNVVATSATVEFNFEKTVAGLDKPIERAKCRPDLGFATSLVKDHDWPLVRVDGDVSVTR